MSRISVPFSVGDLSALARALREQLAQRSDLPTHLELLNMLARAGGWRNYQALRAQQTAAQRLQQAPPEPPVPVDYRQVERVARYFDTDGRLTAWPAKAIHQSDALWVLWSSLPARTHLSEDQLNTRLRAAHRFNDHALLRRELCDRSLLSRTADGRTYRRVEQAPPPQALALVELLRRAR